MADGMIHCIGCGATIADTGTPAKCAGCGSEFEYRRVEAAPDAVLPYASNRPQTLAPPRKLDGYCFAALLLSLVSCLFPLIPVVAIGLAVYGMARIRRTGLRGSDFAVTAMFFSVIGLSVWWMVFPGSRTAHAAALNIKCVANLRYIGQAIMLYEDEFAGARGYGLNDVAAFMGTPGSLPLGCPDIEPPAAGGPAVTYVLLSSLQPFQQVQDKAGTVIALELHTHHVPASDGFPETTHINALFADGHVEGLPVGTAAGTIEKSLRAARREHQPATRP